MSSLSPASVLFDSSGNPLAVSLTSAIPANTSGLISLADGYVTTAAPAYTNGTYASLSLDALGNLRTIASQSGAPWSTTTTGTGSAGSPAVGVVTVQGITGGTPLVVSLSGTGNAIDGYVTTAAPAYSTNTTNYLSLDTSGNLRTLASQNGTWTMQPGNTANTTPWLFTVNQGGNSAVVKNTTPLSSDQALVVALSPNSSLTAALDGYVTTAAPAYSTGTSAALSLDTSGNLRVLASQNGAPWSVSQSGTWTVQQGGAPWSQNVTQFGGSAVVTGTGASGAGIPRVTVSNDSNILATQSGSWTVAATESGTWTVQPGNVANTTPWLMIADGYVTTAAPAYSTGTQANLSLTTTGNLRVQTAAESATAAAVPANADFVGALVVSTPPTYTAGNLNGLTETTAGRLIVDGSQVTQPVSQTGSPWGITGSGTAGTPATGVVTIQGISGGTPLTVTADKSTTGTMTSVSASATSVQVLAANANRVGAAFFNDSTNILYLAMSASAASLTAFTIKCMPGVYTDLDVDYTGQVNGIWNGTNGAVRVTEWT